MAIIIINNGLIY